MNAKKLLIIAALAMAILVVSMPVVFAQQIIAVTMKGSDDHDGFAKRPDILHVNVSVQMNDLTTPKVAIYWTPNIISKPICSKTDPQTKTWMCSQTRPLSEYAVSGTYKIYLFNPAYGTDITHPYDSDTKKVTIDALAPRVTSLTVDKQETGISTPITITYDVKDYGDNPNSASNCIGLKEIRFYDNNTQFAAINEGLGEGVCSKTGTVQHTFGAQSKGVHKICAEAIDIFGQTYGKSESTCNIVTVYDVLPTKTNFTIIDRATGNERKFLKSSGEFSSFDADVRVTLFSIRNIPLANVKADFSDVVSTGAASSVKYRTASSRGEGSTIGNQTFVWENVPVARIASPSCNIKINATDDVGNFKQETIPCSNYLRIDDTGPTYVRIYTTPINSNIEWPVDIDTGYPFFGNNVAMHTVFSDTDSSSPAQPGVGMNSSAKAYADLHELGLEDAKKADSCNRNATNPLMWDCVWNLETVRNTGAYNITIRNDDTGPTSDDFDNLLGSAQTVGASSNADVPEFGSPPVWNISRQGKQIFDAAIEGDRVFFLFNITNKTGLINYANILGFANFSSLRDGADSQGFICSEEGLCEVSVQVSTTSAMAAAPVSFDIYNGPSNRLHWSTTVPVYGVINSEHPDNWYPPAPIVCQPTVDRQIAELYQGGMRVSCAVPMIRKGDDTTAKLIFVDYEGGDQFENCAGDTGLLYPNGIKVMNTRPSTNKPYLAITLQNSVFRTDDLTITCPFQIYTRFGTAQNYSVTTSPELKNITTIVKFYNNPLGDLNAQYDVKIKHAVTKAKQNSDFIRNAEKVIKFASTICRWKTVITNIIAVLDIMLSIAGFTPDPYQKAIKEILCPTEGKINRGYDFDFGFLDYACSLVNCQITSSQTESLGFAADLMNNPICKVANLVQDPFGWFKKGDAGWADAFSWGGTHGNLPTNQDMVAEGANFNAPMYTDIKESRILSALCFCIPGYIYGLNKEKQIQCQYANCLIEDVKKGVPIRECDRAEKRQMCAYVNGELFNFIPYSMFFEKIGGILKDALSTPSFFLQTAAAVLCSNELMCKQPGTWYTICAITKTISKMGDAWNSLKNRDAITDSVNDEACAKMDKLVKQAGLG